MSTIIIAEAGVNHNGDLSLAKELIVKAAKAGADLIKFQTYVSKNLVTPYGEKAKYQLDGNKINETQLEMIQKYELSKNDHKKLIEECKKNKIKFFSTAFDFKSFDLLEDLGCLDKIKIPSGELTNIPLIRYMSKSKRPVFLSTGMATLKEIDIAIQTIEAEGVDRKKITLLQCTTDYPTKMNDVNLLAMVYMGKKFGVEVGYSDHTTGIEVPIAAVALGAKVIEKHFTLDKKLPGPDHKSSIEFNELKEMVKCIRNVENALGDRLKKPTAGELKNKIIVRKSIVAKNIIKQNEIFTENNITTKRPGSGISPLYWDKIIGKKAKRKFDTNEAIEI